MEHQMPNQSMTLPAGVHMSNDSKKLDMNSLYSNADLLESLRAEIEEIEKYKWCMGERIGHDPLQDRSMNDICQEWIAQYAADFRKWWQQERRKN